MSQTLYRKYRSQTFGEIVGQKPIVRILRNSVSKDRINHAYLFTGPRGTGKTSIARILAKALNCLNTKDGDACGSCEICTSIASGNVVDVIEIDAASNRGIDSIRDLREKVSYAPISLKRKIYIIDEVHMITREGFNALLKTLEEPPSHVVFMLCTTEAHKVPVTILSRCVRFDFHRLPPDDLSSHLSRIAELEGFSLADSTAHEIAELAECSARDALSLLDQLMVYCESEITTEAVRELFQLGDPQLVPGIIDRISSGETTDVLAVWDDLVRQGADPGRFLLECSAEMKQRYLASRDPRMLAALEAAWQGINLLKFESFPSLLVELTLLKAAASLAGTGVPASVAAVEQSNPPTVVASKSPPVPTKTGPTEQPQATEPARQTANRPWNIDQAGAAADKATPARAADTTAQTQTAARSDSVSSRLWQEFIDLIQQQFLTTYSHLYRGVAGRLDGRKFIIVFPADQKQAFGFASRQVHLDAMLKVIQQVSSMDTWIELQLSGSKLEPVSTGKPAASAVAEQLPDDVLYDVVEEPLPVKSAVPGEINELDEINADLGFDSDDEPVEKKIPTAQDAITLFDATELDPEE